MLRELPSPENYTSDKPPKYGILLDGERLQLLPEEILDFCWGGGLDTPCSVCRQDFDIATAPPVRTIQLSRPDSPVNKAPSDFPCLEVINTHLHCLRVLETRFIPISHAWHAPVADAYASKEWNAGAARMVFDMPYHTLLAARKRFGPNIQIWHDYISIPQWQDDFRGTSILPQIFQTFNLGGTALLHMDRLNLTQLEAADEQQAKTLFSARWFSRLWPVVELNMCQDAFIMNAEYEISSLPLSSLVTRLAASREMVPSFVESKIDPNCLGHIYDITGSQGCRWHRDHFIAACTIAEPSTYPQALPQLPTDPKEACLWLSKRCLERGDFSVLLMRPVEGEVEYQEAKWLRGHEKMSAGMWGLGPQTTEADVRPRVEGDVVVLDLQFLGSTVSWSKSGDLGVRCQTCSETSTFRAEMWQDLQDMVQVYQIPGLSYKDASTVSMVVENGRVIGRIHQGRPICHCHSNATIRLY